MLSLVSAYNHSGQSVREFCREQGIAEHLLRYWLKRRSHTGGEMLQTQEAGFSELKVVRPMGMSLELPGGLRVGLDGMAPQELAALLLELDRQCHA